MLVRIVVTAYCCWLMICYTFLSFKAWDSFPSWLYYLWDKSFGCGFVVWLCLYINVNSIDRKVVAPIVFFSFIRWGLDLFGFISGITAYNEWRIAALFLGLLIVFYVLTLKKSNFADNFLDKHLLN